MDIRITEQQKIGSGGFSDVYKIKDGNSGKVMAMKRYKKEIDVGQIIQEIEALKRFSKYDNVLKLIHVDMNDPITVYTEYLERDLQRYINQHRSKKKHIKEHRLMDILEQILIALVCIHNEGYIHMDIKPGNILVDKSDSNTRVVLADLGLVLPKEIARKYDNIGTVSYQAPEVTRGKADYKSDIYSLGITMYELCTLDYYNKNRSNKPILGYSSDMKRLINMMLRKQAAGRPSSQKLLQIIQNSREYRYSVERFRNLYYSNLIMPTLEISSDTMSYRILMYGDVELAKYIVDKGLLNVNIVNRFFTNVHEECRLDLVLLILSNPIYKPTPNLLRISLDRNHTVLTHRLLQYISIVRWLLRSHIQNLETLKLVRDRKLDEYIYDVHGGSLENEELLLDLYDIFNNRTYLFYV